MLRKFTNFIHRELFRVSSQHPKVLPFSNSTSNPTQGSELNPKKSCSTIVKKPKKDGQRIHQNFEKVKSFINYNQEKFYRGAQTNDLKEDFVVWCTGVLTISSAIVGHKWFKRDKQECPLQISSHILQRILEPLNRSHAVLAINAEANQNAQLKKKKDSHSTEAKLKDLLEKYQTSARECNGAFLNELGLKYGRNNDYKQAFALFKEASNFGNSAAMFNMALSYEKGIGINRSYIDAAEYYKKAGDVGHAKALFNLSLLYYAGLLGINEAQNGFEFAKKAADLGLCKAQLFVGLQYTKKEEWESAFKCFKMAAEQKDVTSMYNLAVCYKNGYGTNKDESKALRLFHSSAKKGNSLAQYQLGEHYQASNDLEQAILWFRKASRSGHPEAQARIEYLEYEISQKNEDDLLTIIESNTLLQVLEPIKNVMRTTSFHKSSSMPSLQKLCDTSNNLQPLLKKKAFKSRSTVSLCM